MQTDSINSRAELFCAHLPADAAARLSRDEWISIALFIEKNLPQWPKDKPSKFTPSVRKTALRRADVRDAKV